MARPTPWINEESIGWMDEMSDPDLLQEVNARLMTSGYRDRKLSGKRAGVWLGIIRNLPSLIDAGAVPINPRGFFYQLESHKIVPKTEAAVKQVTDILTQMRKSGIIPISWIVDHGREIIHPETYTDLREYISLIGHSYQRDLMTSQKTRVILGVEKAGAVPFLEPIARRYRIPMVALRGYSSLSLADDISHLVGEFLTGNQEVVILYCGDHDPSGTDIDRALVEQMSVCGVDPEQYRFIRVCVTQDQISEFSLPTRPTKSSDTRSGGWQGDRSVELDAIPVPLLREIVEKAVLEHIDPAEIEREMGIEQQEIDHLTEIMASIPTSSTGGYDQ